MITKDALAEAGKCLKELEEEYFKYLKARTRRSEFKVDISHQNLISDKAFHLKNLDIKDYEQLLKGFQKLGIICPSAKNPDKWEWLYKPWSLGRLYFGEVDAPEPLMSPQPKVAVSTADAAVSGNPAPTPFASPRRTDEKPRSPNSLVVELQTKSGFVIRFEVPKDFAASDARRLKAMIDAQVVAEGE